MCEHCGGNLPPKSGGPPRKFCSITCKEHARQARNKVRAQEDEAYREHVRRVKHEQWLRSRPEPKPRHLLSEATERSCTNCGEMKPVTDFYWSGGRPKSRCKACLSLIRRKRYAADPEAQRRAIAQAKKWQQENPDRAKESRRKNRHRYAVQSYGLSWADWTAMLIAQSGRCAICSEPMEKPNVDHCHNSNEVRGLLCSGCNTGIGLLGDDVDRLRSAIEYLVASGTFTPAPAV